MTQIQPQPQPQPSFGPTRPGTLLLAGLFGGVLARWVFDVWYGELPPLSWGPAVTVAVIAVFQAAAAWRLRSGGGRPRADVGSAARPGGLATRPPIEPLLVARLAVLAKASAVLGSLIAGVFAGALLWLLPQREALLAVAADVPPAVGGAVAGAALVAAALWLEYTCRIPPREVAKEPTDGVSDADMG